MAANLSSHPPIDLNITAEQNFWKSIEDRVEVVQPVEL